MTTIIYAARLRQTLRDAGVLIDDVSIGVEGQSSTVKVFPASLQASAQPHINAFDWSAAADSDYDNLQHRAIAKALLSDPIEHAKLLRALAEITKDEINLLRQWLVSFKAQVAAATTLADLKTRVATLPAMPDRTLAQLKTAMESRLDSGTVDT